MKRVYTDEWNGFKFAAPTYLDGHFDPHKFDLVKTVNVEPYEVIDLKTGEKRISTKNSFVVATLTWDPRDLSFEFESCGLRYLQHRIDGLEKFILDFCEMMREDLSNERT